MTTHPRGGLRRTLAATLITLSTLGLAGEASAQRVSPMSYDLAPSGSGSSTNLLVENTSATDMTIELIARRASVDDSGEERRDPADDDFLIFPPQLMLGAGKTQTVRVKYIGEPVLEQSVPYRISVQQVPVDMRGEGQSAVGLAVNFHTLAHVVPKGADVALEVVGVRGNAAGGWDVEIVNRGRKMARLSRTEWTVSDGRNRKSLNRQQVAAMTERNLVMPGQTAVVSVPSLPDFDPASTRIEIEEVL